MDPHRVAVSTRSPSELSSVSRKYCRLKQDIERKVQSGNPKELAICFKLFAMENLNRLELTSALIHERVDFVLATSARRSESSWSLHDLAKITHHTLDRWQRLFTTIGSAYFILDRECLIFDMFFKRVFAMVAKGIRAKGWKTTN